MSPVRTGPAIPTDAACSDWQALRVGSAAGGRAACTAFMDAMRARQMPDAQDNRLPSCSERPHRMRDRSRAQVPESREAVA
jgi:hypothetical protein